MKKWVVAILAFVLFVAWCEFRPKRLVINQRVNDKFPTTGSAWIVRLLKPEHSMQSCNSGHSDHL